jgi:hypothetical protein
MKKILIISLCGIGLLVLVFFITPIQGTKGRLKSYYSGDAISYQGQTVIATTNTGKLELFILGQNGNIDRFAEVKSYDRRFGTLVDFRDVLLNIETGSLYAYTVDGKSFVKYDISDLRQARVVSRTEDNSWDWFGGLEKIDGYVSTVGTNGIKLWTANLNVFDQYKITTPGNYTSNTTSAGSQKFIFTVADGQIKIYDRETRNTIKTIPLTFTWAGESNKRSVYNDNIDDSVYVVDDAEVKKINFNGEISKSFDHTGPFGYDVTSSSDGKYIYFTDGIGIVKLRKSDFAVIDYLYTQSLGGGNGWATGIKVLDDPEGDKIVLFNGSGIIILDQNLEPMKNNYNQLTIATTTEIEMYPVIIEPVYLSVDRNRAASNSIILLSGGGFGKSEIINIDFLNTRNTVVADEQGSFSIALTVPVSEAKGTDIKVVGQSSGIKYNLGFFIE